ncbi:hypothetical protein Q4Q39_05875 [Flavivirga amylovorans]|uniref:Uncharacterized protein n=1 Tax=Flavivirga amylovorans TaxID=870486 RepID=A0ABT8WZK8_9FLAO|nr:hypothetical protein [Flavivirga amylovorans]MDO5986932.1 hypothetical protein [Flavivirga amylovorans]
MIEDELIKIWQSSSNQELIKFEKSKLMIELQSSLGRLYRWWKYIELVEVISVIIGILSFVFIAYWVPFTTSKIASVLIIIFNINILIQVLGIKKIKPNDLEENYLEYLKKTKKYLESQKKLLETAVYWVVLPIYPILLLFFIGLWKMSSTRYLIVVIYLVAIGMGIYGYFLNKKRVKNEIDPRIDRVDELIKTLKE